MIKYKCHRCDCHVERNHGLFVQFEDYAERFLCYRCWLIVLCVFKD